MALKRVVAALHLSFLATSALPALTKHVVHEDQDLASYRWLKGDRVPPYAILPVRIGLVQSNLDKAHEYLDDVANPASSNYGKHWTSQQVIETFQPGDDTLQAVRSWLTNSGINGKSITHSANKAWFAFHATARQMEALLLTEYHEYQDLQTGGIMPACERYHVPEHIHKHIDYITPGVKLLAPVERPQAHQKRSLIRRQWPHQDPSWGHDHKHHRPGPWPKHHPHPRPPPQNPKSNLSTCDISITPACIAALYEIPPGHLADPSNSMGIFEAELQYWDQTDLDLFFTNFTYTGIPLGTHPSNRLIDGGVAIAPKISDAGEEAMLDLDMSYPIGEHLLLSMTGEADFGHCSVPAKYYSLERGRHSLSDLAKRYLHMGFQYASR